MKMLTSRDTSVLAAVLIGVLAWPLSMRAQNTPPAAVEPPSGWFGVTISDQAMLDERGNAFFDSYPVVTTVAAGSPAARAGVVPGDVLVSFNSHDMRGGSIQMRKWLRPGAPFVLRLRRTGAERVVRGTLGKPPENWEKRVVVELSMPERIEMRTMTPAPEPTPAAGLTRLRVRAPAPA